MGKKGAKARLANHAYHSIVATAAPIYHNRAACLGGSRIAQKNVKPGRGEGRTLCAMCARMAAA